MSRPNGRLYTFGSFQLYSGRRLLLRDGQPVPLTPKTFDTLLGLVENRGRVVTKDELMAHVWSDTAVEESGLTRNISVLRKALGESPEEHRYIVTVPGSGYRFVADVSESVGDDADLVPEEQPGSETGFRHETRARDGAGDSAARGVASTTRVAVDPTSGVLLHQTGASSPVPARSRRSYLVVIGALVVGLAGAAGGIYELVKARRSAPVSGFTRMRITSLIKSGKPVEAAIAPDGKYVAYVVEDGSVQSLLVRQVVTTSVLQIIAPAEVNYQGITFSRDGNFIDYVVLEEKNARPVLYQVPVLGGEPRRLSVGVNSPVTFSPDGSRMAFVRVNHGVYDLILANANGSDESVLATRTLPDVLWKPAWSPDGQTLACSAGHFSGNDNYMNVVEIAVADGASKPIGSQKWNKVEQVEWLGDGNALLVAGVQSTGMPQIWEVSRATGETQRITNDLNQYAHLSVTANTNALVTVSSRSLSSLWIVPEGEGAVRQVPLDNSKFDSIMSACWAPDGRIVYAANDGGNRNIWIVEADGSGSKRLTIDDRSGEPCVTPDGRHILFSSDRSGTSHIWEMDIDGAGSIQLTNGEGEGHPQCSPDCKWVVFDNRFGKRTLWKVAMDGGEPLRLCDEPCGSPCVSPDGTEIAAYRQNEAPSTSYRLVLVPFGGGEQKRLADLPPTTIYAAGFKWTPDGRAVTYVDAHADIANLWSQPLDGGPAKQLTDFKSEKVFGADWSRDGKRLVCLCGTTTREVVLITDFR
jgi:eukaryotic-like serine/threonine-protein kinase